MGSTGSLLIMEPVTIIDDWLLEKEYDELYKTITYAGFPWTLITKVNDQAGKDDFQFAHKFVDDRLEVYGGATKLIRLLMRRLYETEYVNKDVEIYRAKANLFIKTDTNTYIPFDPANTDYQEYLKWVANGGTVEEAD